MPSRTPTSSTVKIRAYQPEDYDAVLRIWQSGFAELAPHAYTAIANRTHFLIGLGVAVGSYAARVPVLPFVVAAWRAFVLSPLGRSALSFLLWRGIRAQTNDDMLPHLIPKKWQQKGTSEFFVAEERATGDIIGCAAVLNQHTLYKDVRRASTPWFGWFGHKTPTQQVVRPSGGQSGVECSVWRVSVDSSKRQHGAGRALMSAVESWALAHGFTRVSLVTGNADSKKFYAALGYEPESLAVMRRELVGYEPDERLTLFQRVHLRNLSARHSSGNILVKELSKERAAADAAADEKRRTSPRTPHSPTFYHPTE